MIPSPYSRWFESRWPVWAAKVLRFFSRLVRTRVIGLEQTEDYPNLCAAHWHGDEIALFSHFGSWGLTLLVSQSKDGEIMARAAEALGYRVTRGSSSRGAVGGLLALIKAARSGQSVVLAVDGPQGPRWVCKQGIVQVAQKAGLPLFPVGVAVSRKFVFKKTWNQVYFPLPFARQIILVGRPLNFPKKAPAEDVEHYREQVEKALHEAHRNAQNMLEQWR
jgi:lysophospholipid acyltransferase (LPLAT)-like uncharacterized protein